MITMLVTMIIYNDQKAGDNDHYSEKVITNRDHKGDDLPKFDSDDDQAKVDGIFLLKLSRNVRQKASDALYSFLDRLIYSYRLHQGDKSIRSCKQQSSVHVAYH